MKFVILIFLILPYLQIAQTNPDYKEREFQNSKDALKKINMSGVAEASIDPDEYKVGSGENIFISISGIEEVNFNLIVNVENYLFIPKVGGINLRGLTLNHAREKIRSTIEKYYKNVEIFISLGGLKKDKSFCCRRYREAAWLQSLKAILDFLISCLIL
ncbi:MAG: polysaccharide biosynthesis/export family protein [Sphingobacteriaceae bacterium]|nr:polysaccharide biosynthesis/export family protein [Sphingobacteriaceae bacterium]